MPNLTNGRGLRTRFGAFLGKKRRGALKSAENVVGVDRDMPSSSQDSKFQNHQEREASEETNIEPCHSHNGLTSDDRMPQIHKEQGGRAEDQIVRTSQPSASEIQDSPPNQEQNGAADFNVDTGYSVFQDSGYVGSESEIKPPKWLYPQLSTGRLILTVEGNNFWEAKGPALETFEKLKPTISAYLETHMTTISNPLYCVFMTGRTADTARPTIVFYFRDINRRKDARLMRDAVRKSGILNRYPGFKTGHSSRPKEYSALFPHENFIRTQNTSVDGMSDIGSSTLTSTICPSTSDRSSSFDHSLPGNCNAGPADLHQVGDTREEILIPSSNISQESLTDETKILFEENVPKLTKLTRWITDIIWPSPDGSQRLWYLCVSLVSVPYFQVELTR